MPPPNRAARGWMRPKPNSFVRCPAVPEPALHLEGLHGCAVALMSFSICAGVRLGI
jgi:hypothetical protein